MSDLVNPANGELLGRVRLGDVADTRAAIAAAKAALPAFSRTALAQRGDYLQRLHDALLARADEMSQAIIEEYGGPTQRAIWGARYAAQTFLNAQLTMENFDFVRTVSKSKVLMMPLGVVGIITPWNASAAFVAGKLAMAIAAGCTAVIKPSELSAVQTQILLECMHEAGLPPGVYNVVNGRGDVVGAELSAHPDIAKISFTGSTVVGKTIARVAADTLKRVTLELGGKSPNIILDDADFERAIPFAVQAAFMNNGQACIAGTRLLVPEHRLEEVERAGQGRGRSGGGRRSERRRPSRSARWSRASSTSACSATSASASRKARAC